MEIYEKDESWIDALEKSRSAMKTWKLVGQCLILAVVVESILIGWLVNFATNKLNGQRLLLVAPGMDIGPIEVPAETQISPAVLKSFAKKIVTLNEQWSYETLSDNMQELFKFYYDDQLTTFTKANLTATDRLNFVTQKQMVSVFKFDWNRSRVSWCGKIKRGCALIVGERRLFVENNRPFNWKPVAYLIFFQAILPDQQNPHAMRVTRLVNEDNSEEPAAILEQQFELAEKGSIREY